MLSSEEKKEMLEDSQSRSRRENFRAAGKKCGHSVSFDDFLLFLDDMQKIFPPFRVSRHITPTRLNKL